LNDLVPLALAYVIDTNRAHFDVVIEQKVEQAKQPLQPFVVRLAWKRAVGNSRASQTLDRFGDAEKLEPAAREVLGRYL
jgi:hypothetical protein